MLKRCIIAENRKLHASPIWVIFFVLPLISAGYGTFNYLQNLEILTERWYSLWTQHTLFYSMLFFPAMVSAYAAYLWRLEHLGHNWNLIMAAPVRPFALFAAKLLVVVKLMCFTQCFVFVLYVACGRLFAGFSDWPPMSIVFYLVRGIFGGLAVAAVQLLLAMLIRSFAVPIFLGLVGGIAGMLIGNKAMPCCGLLPDAAGHERQPQHRRAGRECAAVFAGVCGLAGGGAFDRKSAAGKNGCESVMFYRAAGAAYRRPGGIWRVAFAGEHRAGHARPLPPRPIFLLAKRPALLYNKSTNKQEARHDCQCCRFCRVRVRAPL